MKNKGGEIAKMHIAATAVRQREKLAKFSESRTQPLFMRLAMRVYNGTTVVRESSVVKFICDEIKTLDQSTEKFAAIVGNKSELLLSASPEKLKRKTSKKMKEYIEKQLPSETLKRLSGELISGYDSIHELLKSHYDTFFRDRLLKRNDYGDVSRDDMYLHVSSLGPMVTEPLKMPEGMPNDDFISPIIESRAQIIADYEKYNTIKNDIVNERKWSGPKSPQSKRSEPESPQSKQPEPESPQSKQPEPESPQSKQPESQWPKSQWPERKRTKGAWIKGEKPEGEKPPIGTSRRS